MFSKRNLDFHTINKLDKKLKQQGITRFIAEDICRGINDWYSIPSEDMWETAILLLKLIDKSIDTKVRILNFFRSPRMNLRMGNQDTPYLYCRAVKIAVPDINDRQFTKIKRNLYKVWKEFVSWGNLIKINILQGHEIYIEFGYSTEFNEI